VIKKNKFSSKEQYGYQKTQNLMLISNPFKSCKKNSCENSYQRKSDRQMEFITFITVCKRFLGELFALFSTDSNSALNFACYGTYIEFFLKHFFAYISLLTLKPNSDETP